MTYFVHQRRSSKSKGSRNKSNTLVFPRVRHLQEIVFYHPQLNLKKPITNNTFRREEVLY